MASSRVTGARLDQLLQQAREPAFWLGADHRLIWVNRAWEELTGHNAAEVAGLPCHAHGPTRSGELSGLGGSFHPPPEALAGRPAASKTLILHPSGERRWRRVEFWPFHNEKGEVAAILGLVRTLEETPLAEDSPGHRLRAELMEVRDRLLTRHGHDTLIGRGPAHLRLLNQIAAAAASRIPVLVVGEAGTGKRLVGRTIHQHSPRPQSSLIPLDCAALPPDVLERELFGSPRDTLYGETTAPTRLALPEGADLLIGDVLDLPRDLQARLVSTIDGPTRLIATTTADPEAALRDERLRPDLYFALTSLVICLAPLRERLDELPLFAQHFLELANLRGDRQRSGFSAEALRSLLAYDWPGNFRELARIVDDAHGRGEGDLIDTADLPASIQGHFAGAYVPPPAPATVTPLDEILTQVERRLIEATLQKTRHNKSRAAELLGISRPRLYRRIKELGLPDETESADESLSLSAPNQATAPVKSSPEENSREVSDVSFDSR